MKIKHPNFTTDDKEVYKNDIALLKLAENISFSDKIQPICLPDSLDTDLPKPINCGIVVGWVKNGYYILIAS